jgi:hypothetical protein
MEIEYQKPFDTAQIRDRAVPRRNFNDMPKLKQSALELRVPFFVSEKCHQSRSFHQAIGIRLVKARC